MLDQIRIVLVSPSHPGNIGACARAMKTMGLSSIYLVRPVVFPHKGAIIRAAGADDVLKRAVVVDSLADALADCHLVFGTSARSRSLPRPVCTPRRCAETIFQDFQGYSVALVFGRESSGLTNSELAQCHYHVQIPSIPSFSSLNLASAVQVIAYEIFSAASQQGISHQKVNSRKNDPDHQNGQNNNGVFLGEESGKLATEREVRGFLKHLESLLIKVKFIDPKHPKMLLQRLYRLFHRAHLHEKEIHILRGILSAIEKGLP